MGILKLFKTIEHHCNNCSVYHSHAPNGRWQFGNIRFSMPFRSTSYLHKSQQLLQHVWHSGLALHRGILHGFQFFMIILHSSRWISSSELIHCLTSTYKLKSIDFDYYCMQQWLSCNQLDIYIQIIPKLKTKRQNGGMAKWNKGIMVQWNISKLNNIVRFSFEITLYSSTLSFLCLLFLSLSHSVCISYNVGALPSSTSYKSHPIQVVKLKPIWM